MNGCGGTSLNCCCLARQQSRSPEDAEDILQDALIRLARKEASGEFVGGQEAWLSYVFASIRRLAVDYGRKSDRRQKREDEACAAEQDEDVYADPWFSSAAADEELKQFMEMQLRKLPSKFSEVIVLKIWGNKPFSKLRKRWKSHRTRWRAGTAMASTCSARR